MSDDDLTSAVKRAAPTEPPPYAGVLARRDRRRTRRRAAVASAGAAALVAAVLGGTAVLGDGDPTVTPPADRSSSPPPSTPSGPAGEAPEWDGEGAPPILLQLGDREVLLEPWGYCYGNACVDGVAQPPFEDVGERDVVEFSFPLSGWEFTAGFKPSGGGDCARTFTVPVRMTGDHTFEVPSAGPAGSYEVEIFGRGPGSDVVTTFAWSTSDTGEIPAPEAAVSFLTDQDDDIVSYGMELSVSGLAGTPRKATATLTVYGRNGSFEVVGPVTPERSCGEGTLFFTEDRDGPEPFLGRAPFRYRVELTLDGTTYVGTAAWPRDENDQPPYTDLTFSPPLPAYTG